ncbi:MAG: Gfo/Idh/MocA family oxidoreductase [Bacteroidota bacterium]
MSTIPLYVIGHGHIGRRHAELITAHPGATLVATCDPLPRAELGIAPTTPHFATLDELLKKAPAAQAACICTPNGLHAPQAIACLEAGLHVVVEKPLALTTTEAEAIIAAAKKANRHVFGVMQNRYSPASAWLKEQIDKQTLGRILQVHLDCFWNRDHRYYTIPSPRAKRAENSGSKSSIVNRESLIVNRTPHPWHGDAALDGGVLFTQFAHFIDLLCWCFGEVTVHAARFVNQNHEDLHLFADSGTVHFSLGAGTLGSLNFSTAIWDRNFESTLTVIGTEGTVKLGGQYMNELRYCHVKGLEVPDLPPSNPANNYGPYTGSAANHHFVIDNVVDVLNGRAAVATTAEEGLAVVKVIEDIYQAGSPAL